MNAGYKQVQKGRWPSGADKAIAVLRAEPKELEERYGLRFSRGQDELDEFQQAALRLDSGRPVLLTRYRRSPAGGTTVSVDRRASALDSLEDLVEALELRKREISWMSDETTSQLKERRASSGLWSRVFPSFTESVIALFSRSAGG